MNVKILTALLAAAMLTTMGAVTASAAEAAGAADTAKTTSRVEISDSSEENSSVADMENSSSADSSSAAQIPESYFVYNTDSENDSSDTDNSEDSSSETENRYYTDDYYQTDGNATLIKKEKVIYESEEMQFIAVTTKDGSVFYILINYTDAGDEDNVYFLNRVDDYDLYALLYANDDNEDGESVDTAQAAKQAADRANGAADTDDDTDTDSSEGEIAQQTPQAGGFGANTSVLLIFGVVALGGVGFAFFKLTGKKKDTKPEVDFDEDVDDFDISDDAEM